MGQIKNRYSVYEISMLLGISTSSVDELKSRLGMKWYNPRRKYRISNSDYLIIENVAKQIQRIYGKVTLSTINKYFDYDEKRRLYGRKQFNTEGNQK